MVGFNEGGGRVDGGKGVWCHQLSTGDGGRHFDGVLSAKRARTEEIWWLGWRARPRCNVVEVPFSFGKKHVSPKKSCGMMRLLCHLWHERDYLFRHAFLCHTAALCMIDEIISSVDLFSSIPMSHFSLQSVIQLWCQTLLPYSMLLNTLIQLLFSTLLLARQSFHDVWHFLNLEYSLFVFQKYQQA